MNVEGALLIGKNNIASLSKIENRYTRLAIITDLNSSLFFIALATVTIAGLFIFSIYKVKTKQRQINLV